MATKEEIREENRKIRYLQRLADLTMLLIMNTDMSLQEATRTIASLRGFALRLFPGKESTFELIYGRRFRRLLAEKYGLH